MAETAEKVEEKTQPQDQAKEDEKVSAKSVEFPETSENTGNGQENSIDMILDMNVEISVSIGKTQIPIKQLLSLSPGSVIKLEKNIEEPVDIYLNNAKFATGSIVVAEDSFAIKVNEILSIVNPEAPQQ